MQRKRIIASCIGMFVAGCVVGTFVFFLSLGVVMNLAHDPGRHPIRSMAFEAAFALVVVSDVAAIAVSALLLVLKRLLKGRRPPKPLEEASAIEAPNETPHPAPGSKMKPRTRHRVSLRVSLERVSAERLAAVLALSLGVPAGPLALCLALQLMP